MVHDAASSPVPGVLTEQSSGELTFRDRSRFQNAKIVAGIWVVGAIADRIWFALDQSVPAWDQAEYLTGAMNYWQALQQAQVMSGEWWTQFWMLSSKVPPLLYISTAPFLQVLGAGIEQSTLVNLLYSLVLLGAVYAIGTCLFGLQVAAWAAGLCLLLPGLYRIRLDYLTDFPLVAIVTLAFCWLTIWWVGGNRRMGTQGEIGGDRDRFGATTGGLPLRALGQATAFGLTFGLALLVKQTALFFLLVPLVWVTGQILRRRLWGRGLQLICGLIVTLLVCVPWYRTNWLIVLTAGRRATVDSAIAEGDPSLLSLGAWTFYLKQLPLLASLPIFVVGLVGLILYSKRSIVHYQWIVENGQVVQTLDYGGMRRKGYRKEIYSAWWQAMRWLLVFLIGGYLLCSLNVNKDERYITPLLPVLAIVLAQGLLLFPDRLRIFRWGAVALASVMALLNWFPLGNASPLGNLQHHVQRSSNWHHSEIVSEVIQAEPYLKNTIGVLPSLPELNQHNLNYFGNLRNFQVHGRQVGTNVKYVEQEARSLSWFVLKDGEQGSIRKSDAQTALSRAILESPDLQEHKSWALPDKTTLRLYGRTISDVQVQPTQQASLTQVKLEQIRIPNQAAPGKPMPITYRWSGTWQHLKSGMVLLTWQSQEKRTPWFHDHAIALGNLQPTAANDNATFQVTELLAALPPADAQGTYTLKATYLNRETGKVYDIGVPKITLKIAPKAATTPAPEVDFVTQLRSLAATMPQGLKALDKIFADVGQLNQLDPVQDYLVQAQQALDYRLQQDPKNLELAYGLALSHVLKRRVDPAIATFERITQLDSKNAIAYAYLAFVNLYDLRPQAAQKAIDRALVLNPKLTELHTLNAVAGLMKGNLVQAWHEFQRSS